MEFDLVGRHMYEDGFTARGSAWFQYDLHSIFPALGSCAESKANGLLDI
jgi:hypothetical protein